ncbi:DUF3575 domain-containing protein [Aureivirga sp. CE67]|uniref:DUF3575 domain-containing protein n=1 Tax=Aureivirga sp. CE67 TaxID=1788983 RepID=UPI0018C948E0|nr:DUF3575 domain-containing protein [Aureivirga sp. CE67]
MKKLVFLLALFISVTTFAQENSVKVGYNFSGWALEYERKIADHFAASVSLSTGAKHEFSKPSLIDEGLADITFEEKVFGVGLRGKYYFYEEIEGFYVGPYLGFVTFSVEDEKGSVFKYGAGFGYQWIFDSGFTIDFNLGYGGKSDNIPDGYSISDDTVYTADFGLKLGYSF